MMVVSFNVGDLRVVFLLQFIGGEGAWLSTCLIKEMKTLMLLS